MQPSELKKILDEYDIKKGPLRKSGIRPLRSKSIQDIWGIYEGNCGTSELPKSALEQLKSICDNYVTHNKKDLTQQTIRKISTLLRLTHEISIQQLTTLSTLSTQKISIPPLQFSFQPELSCRIFSTPQNYQQSMKKTHIPDQLTPAFFKPFHAKLKPEFYSDLNKSNNTSSDIKQYAIINPSDWDKEGGKFVEGKIHFIWYGGMLSEKHQNRLKEWKRENPSYEINIWIDEKYADEKTRPEMQKFANENTFQLKNIREIFNSNTAKIFDWIDLHYSIGKLDGNFINYGSLSDISRYLILHAKGGWYFDTDIIPIQLPQIRPHYEFFIYFHNTEKLANEFSGFSPAIIASVSESQYAYKTVAILQEIANSNFASTLVENVSSCADSICETVTMITTGQIGLIAAEKITVNNKALVTLTEEGYKLPLKMVNLNGFMPIEETYNRERSWFFTNEATPTHFDFTKLHTTSAEFDKIINSVPFTEITMSLMPQIPSHLCGRGLG